jgi:hypothetical protein
MINISTNLKLTCMRLVLTFSFVTLVLSQPALGMSADDWNLKLFGHAEVATGEDALISDAFELGEAALFMTGRLSSKWSILSEISLLPKRYRADTVKVERLRLRYEISTNHWMSFGKMHTPVNEWNDAFHHGRLFFPSIDRPFAFSEFVPIHEVGLRVSGENLGSKRLFYDLVLGSGQSAGDDVFPFGVKSFTASAGFWPTDNLKLRFAAYRDTLIDHLLDSSHGAEHNAMMGDMVSEDLKYNAYGASLIYNSPNFEALTELLLFRSEGSDTSYSIYQRVAFPGVGPLKPYLFGDYLKVDQKERHFAAGENKKLGVGLEWLLGSAASLKFETTREDVNRGNRVTAGTAFRLQFAFGI